MDTKHYIVIAGFLASFAALIGGLPSWEAATSPLFASGVIGAIAAAIGAFYVEPPK